MKKLFKEDLSGKRFGKFLVFEFHERRPIKSNPAHTKGYWKCVCDCGTFRVVQENDLKRGHSKSCGCTLKEVLLFTNITHNMSKTKIFKVWQDMKKRCSNSKHKSFSDYGGRGITYSSSWEKFENFMSDMYSEYREGLTLERKDVNGNYCRENCCWMPKSDQSRNRRKTSNNTSGVTGVSYNKTHKAWVCLWLDESGTRKAKTFRINKYGENGAFNLACEYRKQMINLLKLKGVYYGEKHGE